MTRRTRAIGSLARYAALNLCGFLLISPAAARPSQVVDYTVRRGDTLYNLSQRYLRRTADYLWVQRLNQVRYPRHLPVGLVLHIPRNLLRMETLGARIAAFRGEVHVGSALARLGGIVGEGDTIRTAANASVTLSLASGTALTIPSQSIVTIRRLRRVLLTGTVDREFAIEQGRTHATVAPRKSRHDRFRITTPVAVAAVRGTEFRVSYDRGVQRATTETLAGKVAVTTARNTAITPAGIGTISDGNAGRQNIALLPAPALRAPGQLQDKPELRFAMEPVDGAVSYHLEIARDAGFLDIVAEDYRPDADARMPRQNSGISFVRLSAIDANGLEGMSRIYSFRQVADHVDASAQRRGTPAGQEYLFRWTRVGDARQWFRFQLFRDGAGDSPVVDRAGLSADHIVVTNLPPGAYSWRVVSLLFADGGISRTSSGTERFTVASDK